MAHCSSITDSDQEMKKDARVSTRFARRTLWPAASGASHGPYLLSGYDIVAPGDTESVQVRVQTPISISMVDDDHLPIVV